MASSNTPPQDRDSYADRRAHPRVPVAMPAFLEAQQERHAVQLLDLSVGGAKLNCSAILAPGTAVVLYCGTLSRSAVVRWQNGGELGLRFESALDAREVAALMARSNAVAVRMNLQDRRNR